MNIVKIVKEKKKRINKKSSSFKLKTNYTYDNINNREDNGNMNQEFYNNQNNIISNNSLQQNNKNKSKKKYIILVIALLLIITGIVLYLWFNNYNSKEKSKENKDNQNQEIEVINVWESETNQLWKDFNSGIITTDEYVKNSLYYYYDRSLLSTKYDSINDYEIHLDDLVDKYYNDLSKETINLYIQYINLENLTFNQTKNNVQPMSNSNKSTANLDEVYLSSNGNFVIWYTTTGSSATTEEIVKSHAETLETAISKYKELFGYDYVFSPVVIKEGNRYKNQIKILEENNISKDYLTSAMQVYVFNFNNTEITGYYTRGYDLNDIGLINYITNYLNDGNKDDVIITPYISINSTSEGENIKEVLNHELFHHYQNYIVFNTGTKNIVTDNLIGEATANWASSKITSNPNKDNALSLWSSNYIRHTSDILGAMYKEKDYEVGYAMYIYLTAYENNVNNSVNKIMKSIHQDNGLKYLKENATMEELNNTISELALKNLSLDYNNNNFYPIDNSTVKIFGEITTQTKTEGLKIEKTTLSPIGIDYYLINVPSTETFTLNLTSFKTKEISFNLITEKNNKYNLVDSKTTDNNTINIDTSSYGNYDKLYIAVANSDLQNTYNYKLEIIPGVVKNKEVFKTDFNNYKLRATSTMVMYGMTTNIIMEGIVDELHQKEYIKTISEVMGIGLTTESYVDFNLGYTYMQNPLSGKWEKSKGATSFIDLNLFTDKIIETEDITKISDTQYKVRLNQTDITKLPNYDNSLSNFNISGSIEVLVTITNGYISKLEYDFSDIIAEIDQFKMVIEFYDYNNAGDVNIPITVINGQ